VAINRDTIDLYMMKLINMLGKNVFNTNFK